MKRVISLWLPKFATDRLCRLRQDWLDSPLALVDDAGGKLVLHAVNTVAEQTGIRTGMTLADARAILPDLQTSEADFVWNTAVPHCKSVADPFCTDSWQANWTKRIDANEWKNYLVEQFAYPVNDSIYGPLIYYFKQPARHAFYVYPQLGIPIRDLRMHFRLKSTWFSIHKEGNEVVLTGKGFGHGVGLCQEGAMGMARKNYTAQQILNFYFTDVLLMNYFDWTFYRQNDPMEEVDL